MDLHLIVMAGPDMGRAFVLHPGPDLMIGRAATSYYKLEDDTVARNHCVVTRHEDRVTIVDNAGGTFVNGIRIERRTLEDGDLIMVGKTQLKFHVGELPKEDEPDTDAFEVVEDEPEGWETLLGQKLSHYQVEELVGEGAWGAVFRATDTKDQHPVALKLLRPDLATTDQAVQHFAKAMKAVLPLRHDYLVPIRGAGKTGPHCWVAREYVVGESLERYVEIQGVPDWKCGFKVARQIGRALESVHQHGVLHGHVTPRNVLRDRTLKSFKLTDLQLARVAEEVLAPDVAEQEELLGEVAYMSPERTYGLEGLDERSDLYSLGATVYTALTGKPPFAGKTIQQKLARIREATPEKPTRVSAAVPPWLEAAVMRLLAKDPDARFSCAGDFLVELEDSASVAGVKV